MASKTFLQLQTELAWLTLDTSIEWIVWGTSNKQAINDAYEYLWDKLKNSNKVKPYISTQKSPINFSGKIGILPANFDTVNIVSTQDFVTWSDLVMTPSILYNDSLYHDYEVRGIEWSKSMYIEDIYTILYISYIPLIIPLSLDWDIPLIPQELHRVISAFALFEYYRKTRENIEAGNALNLANSILNEKLSSI